MKDFSKKLFWPLILIIFLDIFMIGEWRLAHQEKVIFCDVGQGDSAMIVMGATQIIIDGGPDNSLAGCVGKYMPYFDRKIEYLIISHPDADHFVGAVEILQRYFVEHVIVSGDEFDSPEYKEFLRPADDKITPALDFEIAKAKIIFYKINAEQSSDNDRSLIFKFIYAGKSILFTGDISAKAETFLPVRDIGADILKIAHHGSKESSSLEFLKAVSPRLAVFSVGADNKFGHPAYIILKRLENLGIKYLRTDESGDIVVNLE